jgi:hypothetical protein
MHSDLQERRSRDLHKLFILQPDECLGSRNCYKCFISGRWSYYLSISSDDVNFSFDYTTLSDALIQMFPDLWSNYAYDNLFSPSEELVNGTAITNFNYIIVDTQALLGLLGAVTILNIFFIAILFTRQRVVGISCPYSLASASTVIPLDNGHESPLCLTAFMSGKEAQELLNQWNFTIQHRIAKSPILHWVEVCEYYLVSNSF